VNDVRKKVRRLKSYNLSTKAWLDDSDFMIFEVKGLVVPEVGAVLVREIREALTFFKPLGALGDYRGACMAAHPLTMVNRIEDGKGPRVHNAPAAALVSSGQVEMWKEYTDLMNHRGFLRETFTDHAEAIDWLTYHTGEAKRMATAI
jgi:hypothetical protein